MKTSKKIILSFLASTVFFYSGVFAAGIDHFEVKFTPNNAEVGEAIDLQIEAVDKNNVIMKDYDGTILIFSESDPEAELPSALEENTYTYSPSDQGVIKFENAVKFKNAGNQNIHIYDLNDDTVFGVAEAIITEVVEVKKIDIEIVSPENGLTIGENSIGISGTTKKNHQIKIIINGKSEFKTNSNEEGLFELKVSDLTDGDNLIKAQVLDADLNVVGQSEEVSIKVDIDSLNIKNIKVTPESVDPENSFEVEIVSNPKLESVQVIINDVLTKLEETKDGVYTAKVYAPKESGVFKIDVKVKDELGHEKIELGSASIIVNKIELEAAKEIDTIEKEKENKPVIEIKPIIINNKPKIDQNIKKDTKIKGLKLVELKSKSILTWNSIEGAKSYNIYKKISNKELELITNVTDTKFEIIAGNEKISYDYFAIKAVYEDNKGEIYEGSLSDATKVKTGPEILILFLLSLFIGGLVLVVKQKIA